MEQPEPVAAGAVNSSKKNTPAVMIQASLSLDAPVDFVYFFNGVHALIFLWSCVLNIDA